MTQLSTDGVTNPLSQLAFQLADTLRQHYVDKGLPISVDARQQAIATLIGQFQISQSEAESALAKGFFESR